jgi:transposase-like protein
MTCPHCKSEDVEPDPITFKGMPLLLRYICNCCSKSFQVTPHAPTQTPRPER